MKSTFRCILFIAGIINTFPSILAFFPSEIYQSYGVEVLDGNYALLLRHRAVLLGGIGGFMVFSAVFKKYYKAATTIGLISMISFVMLYFFINDELNSNLTNIMIVDVVVVLTLFLVGMLYLNEQKNANYD